jgi:hypothetical protein
MRTLALAAFAASASAFSPVAPPMGSRMGASRVRASSLTMEEPSSKAITIGAAAFGGAIGVQLTGELSTAVVFAAALAYGSTLSNGFGEVSKTVGSASAKVYSKTVDLNEEYDLLPKAKSALDTTVTVAGNLDANYGITERLGLPAAIDKATAAIDEVRPPPIPTRPTPTRPGHSPPLAAPTHVCSAWPCSAADEGKGDGEGGGAQVARRGQVSVRPPRRRRPVGLEALRAECRVGDGQRDSLRDISAQRVLPTRSRHPPGRARGHAPEPVADHV